MGPDIKNGQNGRKSETIPHGSVTKGVYPGVYPATREMPQTLNGRDEFVYNRTKVSKTVMDNTISGIVQDHLAKFFCTISLENTKTGRLKET